MIQLPADIHQKAAEGGASAWVPATHAGDLEWSSGLLPSTLWPLCVERLGKGEKQQHGIKI